MLCGPPISVEMEINYPDHRTILTPEVQVVKNVGLPNTRLPNPCYILQHLIKFLLKPLIHQRIKALIIVIWSTDSVDQLTLQCDITSDGHVFFTLVYHLIQGPPTPRNACFVTEEIDYIFWSSQQSCDSSPSYYVAWIHSDWCCLRNFVDKGIVSLYSMIQRYYFDSSQQ